MLFKDTPDFISVYTAGLKSIDWGMLQDDIYLTEQQMFRTHVLGNTLYDALHAAYQASIAPSPTPVPAPLDALLPKVRKAVAYFAMHGALRELNVLMTSGGAMVNEAGPGLKHAPMWRTRDKEGRILEKAHGHLDLLIDFLVDNEVASYSSWSAAPFRTEVRESLIPSVKVTDRYLRLGNCWLLYMLRPTLRSIQNGPVKKVLGDSTLATLVNHVHNGGLTSDENALLEEARPAMIHLALAEQIVELGITVNKLGVWNWEAVNAGQISGGEKQVTDDRLTALKRDQEIKGHARLEAMRKLVEPNVSNDGYPGGSDGQIYFGG